MAFVIYLKLLVFHIVSQIDIYSYIKAAEYYRSGNMGRPPSRQDPTSSPGVPSHPITDRIEPKILLYRDCSPAPSLKTGSKEYAQGPWVVANNNVMYCIYLFSRKIYTELNRDSSANFLLLRNCVPNVHIKDPQLYIW